MNYEDMKNELHNYVFLALSLNATYYNSKPCDCSFSVLYQENTTN